MAPNVTAQFLKYKGAIHWRHDLIDLGSDTYGRWLGGPRGTTLQLGDDP